MSTKRPRIVITGVAGFIGCNLAADLLKQGFEVVGIDNLAYGVRAQVPAAVHFHRVDIRGTEFGRLIHPGDVIFHLAAKNCISECREDPLETASINVLGTVTVFEGARRAGAAKVIYAESSALYEGTRVFPTPESENCPESFYAISKMAGRAFASGYQQHCGLRMTALRYFCVYGPRQDYRRAIPPVMSAFILTLLRGQRPVIYGTGEKRRDFVHVDDVNRFHLQCIEDPRTDGRVFNLGSGKSHSILEVYRRISRMLGARVEPIFEPDLPGEAQETLADVRAAASLGWVPRKPLDTALREMVDDYRNLLARDSAFGASIESKSSRPDNAAQDDHD